MWVVSPEASLASRVPCRIAANDTVRPRRLRAGGCVGLVTPSSSIHRFPKRTERAIAALEALGFRTVLAPRAAWSEDTPATGRERAADINWCLENPEVDAVLCTTGGTRAIETLDHIDYDLARRARKVICGFSDITAITSAVHRQAGLICFSGPSVVPSFGDAGGPHPYTVRWFLAAVTTSQPIGRLEPPDETSSDMPVWELEHDRPRRYEPASQWRRLVEGHAEGELVGGHLGTIRTLIGSEHFPCTAGNIVFLETNATDIDTVRSDLHRVMRAGAFDAASGLLFGRPVSKHRLGDWDRMLTALATRFDLPLLVDVDLGHTVPMITIPIGVHATMDACHDGLVIDGPSVDEDE